MQFAGNLTVGEDITSNTGTGLRHTGGVVTLTRPLAYGAAVTSATLTVDSGTLTLGNATTSLDGSAGNTNLTINGSGELVIASPINVGAGSITRAGNGTLTFAYDTGGLIPVTHTSGAIGFSGTQTGVLAAPVAANKAFQFNSDPGAGATITAPAGSTVIAGFAATQIFLNRISAGGAGNFVLGADTAAALDFSAYPAMSLGARGRVVYSGALTAGSGGYLLGGTFAGATLQDMLTLTQPLAGSNALTVRSGGMVDLTRVTNTQSGAITVNGGTLLFTDNKNLGADANTVTLTNGGTLRTGHTSGNGAALYSQLGYTLSGQPQRAIVIGAGGGTIQVMAPGGSNSTTTPNGLAMVGVDALTGAAGTTLTKSGYGHLFLTGANSFSGALEIEANGGTVQLRAGGSLPNVSSITVNQNATFFLNNFDGLGPNRNGGFPAANLANRANSAAALTLNGGAVTIRSANALSTQAFAGLTLGVGQASIASEVNAQGPTTGQAEIDFGPVTRALGSTIRFGGNIGTLGAAPANATTRYSFGAINGGPALVDDQILAFSNVFGTDLIQYETSVTPNSVRVATYTDQATGASFTPAAANIYRITGAAAGTATLNSAATQQMAGLKFNSGDFDQTLAFTTATDTLYLGTANSFGGAITVAQNNTATARLVNIGSAVGNGRITAGVPGATTPQELFLHYRGGAGTGVQTLVINSNIVDNNALAPVTVVKADDGTVNLTAANTYTGGTFINRGRILANVAGALGTGAVTVRNAALTLPVAGTVSGSAIPVASPVFTITHQSELFLSGGVAYTNANDRFDLGPGSNVAATAAVAGQGLNSLTYVAPTSPFTGGGQIRLAPGAVVRATAVVQNADVGRTNMIQGLPSDASLYINFNSTNGDGTTLTLGPGTPWKGIAAGKVGATFTAGTIFANGDFELQGTAVDNGFATVTLGSSGIGTYAIVNNAGRPISAFVYGPVTLAEGSMVTMPSDLTFVVTNGATLTAGTAQLSSGQFGSGTNLAKVLVQAGGTLDPSNYVNVGLTANQPVGFPYPVVSPINTDVTIEAGGRLLLNDASGLGSSNGVISMKRGSVLHLANTQAFLGSGDYINNGVNDGLIKDGQIAFEPGVIARVETDNIFKLDRFLSGQANGQQIILEAFNGNRIFTLPTNPQTGLVTPQNLTFANGGGIVADAVDSRQINGGTNNYGGRLILNNGAFVAAASGSYLNLGDDLEVPAGATVNIGQAGYIDGLPRLGGVQLNASNSNRIDGTLAIQAGAQLSFLGVNVYPDTKALDLPLAVTNLVGGGILPGTGTSLLLNNGTAEVIGALTGLGAVISNNAAGTLVAGYGGGDFTFGGVISNTGTQQARLGKLGTGTMTLTGTSTSTANLDIYNGTVVFKDAGAAAFGTYLLQGGNLLLDNTTGAALDNRLGGTGKIVSFPGSGELKLTGNATVSVTEAFGTLALTSVGGNGKITVDPSANGAGVTTTLSIATLTNTNQTTNGAAFVFRGPGLAGTPGTYNYTTGLLTANPTLNGAVLVTTPNFWSNSASNAGYGTLGGGNIVGSIGTQVAPMRPDGLGDINLSGIGTGYVTADSATGGLRLLANSEYGSLINPNVTQARNIRLAGAVVLPGGDTRIQSLTLLNGASVTTGSVVPHSLTPARFIVQSGGIYVPTGATASITAPFLSVQPGASYPLYFHAQGDLTVNAALLNNNNGFIKNGAGTLTLGAGALNAFSGSSVINEGTVILGAGANSFYVVQPGAAAFNYTGQRLNLNGGTFDLTGHSQVLSELFSNGLVANSNSTSELMGGTLTSATPASVTVQSASANLFAGNIAGAISLTKGGSNGGNTVLTLTQANTYTGDTFIRAGTLRLRDQGRLVNSPVINVMQATLEFDNTGLGNLGNRIASTATVNLRSGATVNLIGSREAAAQTIHTTNLLGGTGTFSVGAGQSTSAELTLTNLNRSLGATAVFQAANFGVTGGGNLGWAGSDLTSPKIFITNLDGLPFSAASLNDGLIGGWATDGTHFLSYVNGQGVGQVSAVAGGFINYSSTDLTTAGATDNVNDATAARTVGTAKTINSLRFNGGAAQTFTLNAPLTIDTGGVLANIGFATNLGGAGAGGSITATGNELFLTNSQNTMTISVPIVDNGGALNLIKAGGGTVVLTADNTFTGKTFVNAGTLTLNRTNAGTAINGDLEINGGTLSLAKVGQIPTSSTITINGGGTFNWTVTAGWTDTLGKVVINGLGGANQATFGGGSTAGTVTLTDPTPLVVVNDNINRESVVSGNLGSVIFAPGSGSTSTLDISGSSPFGLVMNANVTGVPSGGLIKVGSGLLAMAPGASTYGSPASPTQVWDVQAGVLRPDAASGLGPVNAVTKVSPAGALVLGGNGITQTGSVNLAGGTLGVTVANNGISGNVAVSANSTVRAAEYFDGRTSRFITLSGVLSGSGNLELTGPSSSIAAGTNFGGLILTNTGNTYDGTFTVGPFVQLRNQPATSGITLGSAAINLAGGQLELKSDAGQTFTNVVTLTADSNIYVDRSSGTSGTPTTQTVNNLNVTGERYLTLTNANSYALRIGTLGGSGILMKKGTVGLTIDAFAPTVGFGVAGADGLSIAHTFNTTAAPNQVATFTPATVSLANFRVGGFYITPAGKTFNVADTFAVTTNPGNIHGALAVTGAGTPTITASTFQNNGQVGATGSAATIAATTFTGSGHYLTNGQALTLSGNLAAAATLKTAGNNIVQLSGSAVAGNLRVESGTLRLSPTTNLVPGGTISVLGSPALTVGTNQVPVDAVQGVLDFDAGVNTITHPGAITNNGTVLASTGTTTVAGLISGTPVTYQPGLLEGFRTITTAFDTSAARPTNPGNGGIRLEPRMAQTNAVTQNPLTGHFDNDTWIYTGYVKDDDGIFSFAQSYDDNVAVWVNGVLVLNANNGGAARAVSTAYSIGANGATVTAGANTGTPTQNFGPGISLPGMGDGWHLVEFRFRNGAGGSGPVAGAGFTANYGFGYKNGIGALDGADYEKPVDNGTGNLFVTPVGGKGNLTVQPGATLNANGGFSLINTVTLGTGALASTLTVGANSEADTFLATGFAGPAVLTLAAGTTTTANLNLSVNSGSTLVKGGAGTLTSTTAQNINGTFLINDGVANFHGNGSAGLGLLEVAGGELYLHPTGSHGGNASVDGGELIVNGTITGDVTLLSGTVRGNGVIGGLLNGLAGGTIRPGNSPGILTVGTLTVDASTTLDLEIGRLGGSPPVAGVDYDQIRVTGNNITLDDEGTTSGALLTLAISGALPGDIFTIIRNDGTDFDTGFLRNAGGTLANGALFTQAGYQLQISYFDDVTTPAFETVGGNDVSILVIVPEPGSATALLGGLGLLAGLRRFRRRG